MLVNVAVKRTTDPGVVVDTLAPFRIVSCATSTAVAQRGSVLPAAQLLPAAAEVAVLARMWLPVSGLLTVTE